MNIKVDYLDSEIVKSGDAYRRRKKNTKKGDAVMINIFKDSDGQDYCHIVLPDGEIKRVSVDLVKVVDNKYT